jgi:hypothetical protein
MWRNVAVVKYQRARGTYRLYHQGDKNRSILRLLVTANVIPSSQILVTLLMEEILSSETSALTKPTRRNISESGNLLSHRRENLKSYKMSLVP